MPTASMFDDPVRERGRLGSIIAGMGDGTGKPTERVANPCLVTDAAEPNAILRTRDEEAWALDEPLRAMSVLSRSDLVLVFMPDRKMCASCPRGSRLQFGYGRWLKWRRCRRHLTVDEKAVLVLKLMEAEAGGLTDD
jgi:hypothetical protein